MQKLTPKFEVLVDGGAAPRELAEAVITLSCRLELEMADMIELRLSNADLRWTESDALSEGKKLSVSLGYVETDQKLVATGTIIRRECEFPERGPAVCTVVAYDKRHILKHGVNSRTWKDTKDSDVVKQLAKQAGFKADVDDTGPPEPYLFQSATTDIAFIRERAMRIGYEVYLDAENETLHFKKPRTSGGSSTKLKWGETLFQFSPRFSTSGFVDEITVRGWDPKKKQPITATAKPEAPPLGVGRSAVANASKFGSRQTLWVGTPSSTSDAQSMAKSWLGAQLLHYADGTALCQGDSAIRPGGIVSFDGVGKRAAGDYYVASVVHDFDHRGYRTFFEFLRPGSHAPPAEKKAAQPAPKPREEPAPEQPTWVEFKVEASGIAVAEGTPYKVSLPDGRVLTGKLDATKTIRLKDIKNPGDCQIELTLEDGTTLLA
jgi:uncharacterized protein